METYHYNFSGVEQFPSEYPPVAVLRTADEYKFAVDELTALQLQRHNDDPKNWDSMAALSAILRSVPTSGRILDAGGEYYSTILPNLAAYGYRNLHCLNLAFNKVVDVSFDVGQNNGRILFEPGDITQTRFEDSSFDAITCLSVIEHGVNVEQYFKEMARILKTNGLLFTSTDYWPEPIDTGNQQAYGAPIYVFDEQDVRRALSLAYANGFRLMTAPADLDLSCDEKVVEWKKYKLRYTFMYFVLQKTGG
jgi:SAM-dependent methyltransferase